MSSRDHPSPFWAAAGRGLLSRSISRLTSSRSSRGSTRAPSLESQRSSITTLGSLSTAQSEGAAADLRDLITLGRVCSESAHQVERSAEGPVLCRRSASFSTSHFVSLCDNTPPSSRPPSLRLESSDAATSRGSSLESMDTGDNACRQQSLCLMDGCVGVVTASGELRRVGGLDNFSPWELQPEDIQFCKSPNGGPVTLGKGAFGEVLLATLKGLIPVAVKKLPTDHNSSAIKEAAMLKALQNANIVQFQGACIAGNTLLLVTEFMEGGDLCKAISKRSVTWHRKGAQVALDVVRGLHYLHSNRVCHLDLKSPNILLSRHGTAKLADIGLARIKQDAHNDASAAAAGGGLMRQISAGEPVIGTFSWAAPELLASRSWTEKADIFSLGVVLWEIVTGEQPKRGCMRPVRVPEECPEEIAQLIEDCMEPEPEQRPSAIEVYAVVRQAQRKAAAEARRRSLAQRSGPLSKDLPPIPSSQPLPQKLAQLLANRQPSEAAKDPRNQQRCSCVAVTAGRATSAPPAAMDQLLESAVGF